MIRFNSDNRKSIDKDEKRFLLIIHAFVLLFGIYSGMYCYRFGILVDLSHHLKAAMYDAPTYVNYLTAKNNDSVFPFVGLDVKFDDYMKLSNQRSRYVYSYDHFFEGKQWKKRENFYAKASIKYKGEKSKVKVKLFGKNNDHFRHPYKWSFRVKTKEYIKEFDNGKFNFLQPNTRLFITDALSNEVLKKHGILNLKYTPVYLTINNRPKDIYFVEDFFSKYLIERNGYRDSFIFAFDDIKHPSSDKLTEQQKRDLETIKSDITNNPNIILDLKKFDAFVALIFIAQNKHPMLVDNFHMFYNNVSNTVEPMIREVWFTEALKVKSKQDLEQQLLKFIRFLKSYNKNLSTYLEGIKNNQERLDQVLDLVNTIAHQIKEIQSSEDWKTFKDAIYTRFPQAVYLCKNIDVNVQAILDLKLKAASIAPEIQKIEVLNGIITLNQDLLLNNTDVKIEPGTTLDLNGFSVIINKGSITAIGSENQKISITNNSEKASSLMILNSKKTNTFDYVDVTNLSNFDKNYWHSPAGITFYQSNASMSNASFASNRSGDDLINFFRCAQFSLENVVFDNVNADAIDSDFSSGKVENCKFSAIGNDAIDGSGSNISITNCEFYNVEDKAISAGENSDFKVTHSIIADSEIAFVAKDDSSVQESDNTLLNNTLDYCIFNKKKEFDFGLLYSDKNIADEKYLIEKGSKIFNSNNEEVLNLKLVDSVKESLYGIEYGKKSR